MTAYNGDVKRAAHVAVLLAVRRGVLTRPGFCSACGRMADTQGHHADYGKPLEVEWLCPACHKRRHPDTAKKERIERLVRADPSITADEMAAVMDLSRQRIHQIMRELDYELHTVWRKKRGKE